MQRVNALSSLMAKVVSTLSITGLIAMSSAATAAAGDVSDGYCDGYTGQQRALCVKAHASAKQVERLETKGSTVKQLNKANAKLAKALGEFEALAGFGVPGLAPECEIPELVTWWNAQQERVADGILDAEPVANEDAAGSCQLSFSFQNSYTDSYRCTRQPSINLRNRAEAAPINVNPVFVYNGSVGYPNVVNDEDGNGFYLGCGYTIYVTSSAPLDYSIFPSDAKLSACARAYGCDAF